MEDILEDTIAFLNKKSQQRSFIQHYSIFKNKIRSYFLSRLRGDAQLAEDLSSMVFTKALEKYDQYNDDFAFSTWVYTIARNTLTDYLRQQNQSLAPIEAAEDIVDEQANFYEVMDAKLDAKRLQHLLGTLPKKQAQAVYRRHFLLQDIAEIATDLDTSEQNTRQLLSRGCRALAIALRNEA